MATILGPTFINELIAAGLGGLPFSWGDNSDSFFGREHLTAEQNAKLDAVIAAHDPKLQPVSSVISDRQFFQALAMQGVITPAEALAAVKMGEIPAGFQPFINALSDEQRFAAEMLLSGATEFQRNHPLVGAIAHGIGWTEAQADDLWRMAATL